MRKNRPSIELPRIIDISYTAIDNVESIIKKLDLEGTCTVVVDDITYKIAGKRVIENIESKYNVNLMSIQSSAVKEAERVMADIQQTDTSFAIAVGGGTIIDVTKYASYKQGIPFISVPTVASHDGIASARASLIGSESRHSFEAHSPIGVIGDVETIAKAPIRFKTSGSADLLSNITAVMDWKLSHRITGEHISQYAVALSEMTANTIIETSEIIAKDRVEGTYIVLKGLIASSMAMCIAGSSRPASGAEHMISHLLDEKTKTTALHGEQCGLTSIITMYLHGGNWKIIKETLEILNSPLSFSEINVSHDEIIDAIVNAQNIRKNRHSILSSGISKKAAEKALNITGIV
ncbi:MAG: iron-containing alcohol dehydrogenase [Candidatus Heimdallarchaeota archaeon]|nr:iron-containing alcohol dehydrogenase [Candidatus Heimdallarchaeota archaeon]